MVQTVVVLAIAGVVAGCVGLRFDSFWLSVFIAAYGIVAYYVGGFDAIIWMRTVRHPEKFRDIDTRSLRDV